MNKRITTALIGTLLISLLSTVNAKVGIIVNKDLYSSISTAVEGYIADLEAIEEMGVWLNATSFTENDDVDELKDSLIDHYENDSLEGVIFIGDLPIVKYYNANDFSGSATFPCDLYWMDLNGTFQPYNNSSYIFTSHSGNKEPEIWMSRITASVLENYFDDEVTMVNEYFARVQERMHGLDDMERKYVIAGQKSEWSGLENENQGDMGYESGNIDTYTGSCGTSWKNALIDGREYGFVYSHSGPTSHAIGFNISGQASGDLDCRFYNSFACSNAKYTTANMCGAYALGDKGLICVGAAKTGSMVMGSFRTYNKPLGEGKNFGEAYKEWFAEEGLGSIRWHYGMTLQGVGTLLLEPYEEYLFITVVKPNGGEEWEQSSTYKIEWTTNLSGNVKIELLKSGSVKKTLESSIENNGEYSWEIATDVEPGTDYTIRISSIENNTVISESAAEFTIKAATGVVQNLNKMPMIYDIRYYNSRIYYQIPDGVDKTQVSIVLYSTSGKLVQKLVSGAASNGYHSIAVIPGQENNPELATGMYLCRMKADSFAKTITVLLQK